MTEDDANTAYALYRHAADLTLAANIISVNDYSADSEVADAVAVRLRRFARAAIISAQAIEDAV